ncbi:MAG: magnesium transporter [Acidobacteria bacterium]|nr:magnesium transporter [Acidobacteriota bacterium]
MNQERFDVLIDSIGRLARRGATAHALNILEKLRPVEVATVLKALQGRTRESTFAGLADRDPEKAAESLSELGPGFVRELLEPLSSDRTLELLALLSKDDAAVLVDVLPEPLRDQLLDRLQEEHARDVQELLNFETETAGRIMTPDFFALGEDVTVSEAITALQKRSEDLEMSFYVYVVDGRNHLLGVVNMRQLLLNSPSTPLRKFMSTDVIRVTTATDQEEVARLVANYNLIALPVVDAENRLVGIVTVDDIIDVIKEEATEDIYALAGVEADDRATGSSLQSIRSRLPWLLLSLGTAMLAAVVVNAFRDAIGHAIVLAVLMPVVLAMGGNAATQSMTVVVRSIGLDNLVWSVAARVILKESIVAALNGAVVGLIAGLSASVWFRNTRVGVVIAVALLLSTVVGGLVGALVPMVLKRMRIDPAIASSIFVTTVTVIVGLVIFLWAGRLLLAN